VLGTINFMVAGTFNAEPASQMSDISAGPQDAVNLVWLLFPLLSFKATVPAFLRRGQIMKLLQASSGSTVGPVMASALNASVNSALPTAIGWALVKIGGPATLPSSIKASRNA